MRLMNRATFSYRVNDEAGTDRFGRALAAAIRDGAVVALDGPLGAGKTRLVQGAAVECGADRRDVVSPTFVLVHQYATRPPIYHIDAYRLRDEDEFLQLGADEYFVPPNITFIEWANRVENCLPRERIQVAITIASDTERQFEVTGIGAGPAAAVERLSELLARVNVVAKRGGIFLASRLAAFILGARGDWLGSKAARSRGKPMAKCAYCGKFLLFGTKVGELRFCGRECKEKGLLIPLAETSGARRRAEHAAATHQQNCPVCLGPGPVDIFTTHTAMSFLVLTQWKSKPQLSCALCGCAAIWKGIASTAVLGWWGFPFGLIITPAQLFKWAKELSNSPDPSQPSDAALSPGSREHRQQVAGGSDARSDEARRSVAS